MSISYLFNITKRFKIKELLSTLLRNPPILLDALECNDRIMVIVENFADMWQIHEILPHH